MIDIDYWNLGCIKIDDEVGGALSPESPAVKYSRFITPIVVIDPLVWIEIGTQNDSAGFVGVQVPYKAMANMNWCGVRVADHNWVLCGCRRD